MVAYEFYLRDEPVQSFPGLRLDLLGEFHSN